MKEDTLLRMRLFRVFATLFALLIFVPVSPAHADTDDFEFESYHADYTLSRDEEGRSTLHTVETLVALFPDHDQNRGVQRAIPQRYERQSVDLEVLSVTDEEGEARDFTTFTEGDFLIVEIATPEGTFEHGRTVYVIEYEQRDVVQHFKDTGVDEWYWDLNGTGWAQPFGQVSANLTVDPELIPKLTGDIACYRGAEGSDETCNVSGTEGEYQVAETGLGAHENVTVAVGFDKDTFEAPPREWYDSNKLFLPGGYVLGGAGFALMIGSIISRARRRSSGDPIIARYTPPVDPGVAQAAHLEGKPHTITTAVLLDLAVRGNIQLLHDDASGLFGAVELHREEVRPEEEKFMRDLFRGSGESRAVWFEKKSTKLGDASVSLHNSVDKLVRTNGYRREPSKAPRQWGVLLILAGFAMLGTYFFTSGQYDHLSRLVPIGIIVYFIDAKVLRYIASKQRPLTTEGVKVRDHLRGLKLYIDLAEKDRLAMLQSASGADIDDDQIVHVYERLLPYAVIFGLEREWHGELASHYRNTAPTWVNNSAALQDGMWANRLHQQVRSSKSTRVSSGSGSRSWSGSSSSSSRGGSSGGGYSGGGRGGGGGRGI